MNWYNVHHREGVAHVSIFGGIGEGGGTAELLLAIGDAEKIRIRINSPGGNTSDALRIYDTLLGRDVEVEIGDRCYSAAAVIAMIGRVIRARADSRLMLHAAVVHAVGDAAMLRCAADRMEKINDRLVAIVATRTGKPVEVVARWYASGVDTYFTPDEAQAVGLVDEILPPDEPEHGPAAEASPGATPATPGFTDAERLLFDMLEALGPLRVADKARLARELGCWFTYKVT